MKRAFLAAAALSAAVIVGMAFASGAVAGGSSVVYNALPSPLPPNVASLGFEATSTSEFGDYVHLAGTNRVLKTVTVNMSDWALYSDYSSDPRYSGNSATWSHPITVNVYSSHLGFNGVPDTLLATRTQNVTIPWRPAADPTCPGGTAWRAADHNCYNGIAFNASFDLSSSNALLTNGVIVGVAYNTADYGASPIHMAGPYNSLNVGAPGGQTASVGTDDNADNVFWNTSVAGFYADGGTAGVGIFRQDTNWAPNGTVAIQITAASSGNQSCNGTIGATTIDGDLTVANGATCFLNGTVVTHDVKVQSGGHLYTTGASIGHDLTLDHAGSSWLCGGSVSHDLAVQNSTGPLTIGGGDGCGINVGHDLTVQSNSGGVWVDDNTVGHDLKVQNNTGGTDVSANSAGHDAACQGNSPQTGSANLAGHSSSCPA